jgi:hypothetical protein
VAHTAVVEASLDPSRPLAGSGLDELAWPHGPGIAAGDAERPWRFWVVATVADIGGGRRPVVGSGQVDADVIPDIAADRDVGAARQCWR